MRWVSLLELLRFYAESFCRLHSQLGAVGITLTTDDPDEFIDSVAEWLLERLPAIRKECADLGLQLSVIQIDSIIERWNAVRDRRLLSQMYRELGTRIADELSTRIALMVSLSAQRQYEHPTEGWEAVVARFPDTQDDIEEASRCHALGRHTAAVFHALMVVEYGIVALGDFLGVSDPKRGWDATSTTLARVLQDGRTKAPPRLVANFGFLEQINQNLQSMKHAWRNKVTHVAARPMIEKGTNFSSSMSADIITACRSFMNRIATDLPE